MRVGFLTEAPFQHTLGPPDFNILVAVRVLFAGQSELQEHTAQYSYQYGQCQPGGEQRQRNNCGYNANKMRNQQLVMMLMYTLLSSTNSVYWFYESR